MSGSVWEPGQYEQFKAERARPFHDLLSLVRPRSAMRVVDLGCGTGELTRVLHETVGARETVGLDSSATMLSKSAPHAVSGLRFEQQDIAAFEARGLDLVFSNAALHWLPDHPTLLGRLASALAPGGQLAVQVPANHDHVAPVLARALAAEEPFAGALTSPVPPVSVLLPEQYSELLHALGFAEQHVRLQVYGHTLPSRDGVLEWIKGSTLTAYKSRLPEELYDRFVKNLAERLSDVLPDNRPFFFTFKRVHIWGVLPVTASTE